MGLARLAAASTVEAVVGELSGDDPGYVEMTVPGAAVTFPLLKGSIVPLKGRIMLVEAVTASEAAAALEVEVASETEAASEAAATAALCRAALKRFHSRLA